MKKIFRGFGAAMVVHWVITGGFVFAAGAGSGGAGAAPAGGAVGPAAQAQSAGTAGVPGTQGAPGAPGTPGTTGAIGTAAPGANGATGGASPAYPVPGGAANTPAPGPVQGAAGNKTISSMNGIPSASGNVPPPATNSRSSPSSLAHILASAARRSGEWVRLSPRR